MKNLFKALAAFQNEAPTIHEDTKGYNYTYSNLNTIFKVIKPLLKKDFVPFILFKISVIKIAKSRKFELTIYEQLNFFNSYLQF